MSKGIAELTDLEREFELAGGTAFDYLRDHYYRFAATKAEFDRNRNGEPGVLLDVGAHWLHQTLLWAMSGWRTIAMDLPATLATAWVGDIAERHSIRLLPNEDLEHPLALSSIADDCIDTVLFTEVIEHVTFNPVVMWQEIYRVLRPGGCIVVTTPNYYALRGRAWAPLRFCLGRGGGLTTDAIIGLPTHAHHWKEYSKPELISYFAALSRDFRVDKARYQPEYRQHRFRTPLRRAVLAVEHVLPVLRPSLHVEVGLHRKDRGMRSYPTW